MSTPTLTRASALSAPAATTTFRTPALLRHSLQLAKRSLIKTLRTPEALIDVTIQPVIFLLLFTYVFGGAISHGSQHAYLQFLLPGILGQSIAFAGIAIGVNLNDDVSKGVFDRFRSLPIARSAPLVGAVLADMVRYTLVFVFTLGFGYLLGFRVHGGALDIAAAGIMAVAFALCLSWVSVFVAMLVRTSGAVQGIMMLVLFPLSFTSSTFVPIATMPHWLQTISNANPLSHLVGVERSLLLGAPMGTHLTTTLIWMAALVGIFFPLAMRAYSRKV
jgi:oleandomycin transport system permease protein